MAEQAHTAGPWVARYCTNDAEWEVVVLDPSQTWNEPHDRCWYVATVMDSAGGGSAEANARLTAAAPDLLVALRALQIQALQSPDLCGTEWGQAALGLTRAAIAKATQP
jgi:hypothetical protein